MGILGVSDPAALSAPMLLTFGTLALSVCCLWVSTSAWIVLLACSVALGYASGILTGPAVVWVALLGGICWLYSERRDKAPRLVRALLGLAVLGVAFALGLHVLPGFNNALVADQVILKEDAIPFTLYLNFDKTVAGILILGVCYPPSRQSGMVGVAVVRETAVIAICTIGAVIGLSYMMGYLRFDSAYAPLFPVWALSNLFFTCLSEEAFFRAFIQGETARYLDRKKWGPVVAVVLSAVLFGIAHLAGGWSYVALASVAGFGYALVYHRTQRIEFAILTHFAVNTTHFLLFTYPRLQ